MSEVKVGIVMTSLNAGSKNMLTALEILGWDYQQLGRGKKWEGFTTKMEEYALFAETELPETILVLIDSYDALPVRKSTGFKEAFELFGVDIVVGAENYCAPSALGMNCLPLENPTKINAMYPNVQSGCVIGRADSIAKMYRWIVQKGIQDDQVGVASYMNHYPDHKSIDLDYDCKLSFHDNWGSSAKITCETDKIIVSHNNLEHEPWFIHFPGFLYKRSFAQHLYPNGPISLPNYDQVGKHILKDDFITIGQVDRTAYYWENVGVLIILSILVFVLIVLVILYIRKSRIVTKFIKLHQSNIVQQT
jgi:hypothetical protein